jgi:isopenicillin N synthase-like dioxygenase
VSQTYQGYEIDQQRVDNQLAIGQEFYDLPLEEKLKYEAKDLGNGGYNGYRPAGRRV